MPTSLDEALVPDGYPMAGQTFQRACEDEQFLRMAARRRPRDAQSKALAFYAKAKLSEAQAYLALGVAVPVADVSESSQLTLHETFDRQLRANPHLQPQGSLAQLDLVPVEASPALASDASGGTGSFLWKHMRNGACLAARLILMIWAASPKLWSVLLPVTAFPRIAGVLVVGVCSAWTQNLGIFGMTLGLGVVSEIRNTWKATLQLKARLEARAAQALAEALGLDWLVGQAGSPPCTTDDCLLSGSPPTTTSAPAVRRRRRVLRTLWHPSALSRPRGPSLPPASPSTTLMTFVLGAESVLCITLAALVVRPRVGVR